MPADTVDGPVAADFAEVPELRDDWLTPTGESPAGDCETNASGVGTCRLSLCAYDRERVAGRFMARHGVTCPFLHDPAPATAGNRSFTAVDGGTHYRVSCIAYGD